VDTGKLELLHARAFDRKGREKIFERGAGVAAGWGFSFSIFKSRARLCHRGRPGGHVLLGYSRQSDGPSFSYKEAIYERKRRSGAETWGAEEHLRKPLLGGVVRGTLEGRRNKLGRACLSSEKKILMGEG